MGLVGVLPPHAASSRAIGSTQQIGSREPIKIVMLIMGTEVRDTIAHPGTALAAGVPSVWG